MEEDDGVAGRQEFLNAALPEVQGLGLEGLGFWDLGLGV